MSNAHILTLSIMTQLCLRDHRQTLESFWINVLQVLRKVDALSARPVRTEATNGFKETANWQVEPSRPLCMAWWSMPNQRLCLEYDSLDGCVFLSLGWTVMCIAEVLGSVVMRIAQSLGSCGMCVDLSLHSVLMCVFELLGALWMCIAP
eukprot:1113324-Amphidinium_carterae.2